MSVFKSFAGLLLILSLVGCNINASVEVPDGATQNGDASTVNGSVIVGDDATVNGDAGTVNGRVRVGSNARVGDIGNVNGSIEVGEGSTANSADTVNGKISLASGVVISNDVGSVNGSIDIAESVRIGGEIVTVNGSVRVESGSTIAGGITTTNGSIRMTGASTASLDTKNGSIDLREGTRIEGRLRVRESNDPSDSDKPEVRIGPGVTVVGPLIFEQEVDLYIHETAEVGEIRGADPMPYPEN